MYPLYDIEKSNYVSTQGTRIDIYLPRYRYVMLAWGKKVAKKKTPKVMTVGKYFKSSYGSDVINPFCTNEKRADLHKLTWSFSRSPTFFEAADKASVNSMSCFEGKGAPLGCVWTKT